MHTFMVHIFLRQHCFLFYNFILLVILINIYWIEAMYGDLIIPTFFLENVC